MSTMLSKFIFALVFFLLVAPLWGKESVKLIQGEDWEENPLVKGRPDFEVYRLRLIRQEILKNGCTPNLCFVIEGGANISDDEFQAQKNFVDLIVAITTTDKKGNFCGTVYDSSYYPITTLTSGREHFLDLVLKAGRRYGYQSDVLPGLAYSIKQLRRQRGDANTVVFFSKDKPIRTRVPYYFKQFVERGNAISAVTFNINIAPDLAKLTGDINRVVPLDGFFDISEIIVAVVSDVCNTDCTTLPGSRSRFRRRPRRNSLAGRTSCPRRLGTSKFKFYKGVGGVGVGFGKSSSNSDDESPDPRRKKVRQF